MLDQITTCIGCSWATGPRAKEIKKLEFSNLTGTCLSKLDRMQDGNKKTHTRQGEAPHLRSSLSDGPAAPTAPRHPAGAPQQMQQREWRRARPTTPSSSRFPQASSQHLLSLSLLSPALRRSGLMRCAAPRGN
jgi:hypothetical protein